MLFQLFEAGYSPKEMIFYGLIMLFAMTVSFSLHEYMHARIAYAFGDSTPYMDGRLTLNPMAHVDMMGLICMLLVGFGWGKPVMVNPSRFTKFKSKRFMRIAVALAGVTMNFIISLVCWVVFTIIACLITKSGNANQIFEAPWYAAMELLFTYTASFSMSLLAFNLIPIYPLDGSKVLLEVLPFKVQNSPQFRQFLRYSPQILFAVIIIGRFSRLNIVGMIMSWISFPFTWIISQIVTLIIRVMLGA